MILRAGGVRMIIALSNTCMAPRTPLVASESSRTTYTATINNIGDKMIMDGIRDASAQSREVMEFNRVT